jgi:hypothetical protein
MLPSTFEERGAAVPFTSPLIAHARVRTDWRDRLELVIGQFAETVGHYVIPWTALSEIFTLTAYDTLLIEQVTEARALDPHAIRQAGLRVTATGLAGPSAASAALKTIKQDDEYRALQTVVLILRVIETVEELTARDMMRDMMSVEGQARIRETLAEVVRGLGQDSARFERHVSDLSDMTAAVGLAWNPEPGRLRKLLLALETFRNSISGWSVDLPADQAEQSRFCADVATITLDIAREILDSLDQLLTNPLGILTAWGKQAPVVAKSVKRLAWLLDGWEEIILRWQNAAGPVAKIATLREILPILPLIPRDEMGSRTDQSAVLSMQLSSRRWVRANENWKTGALDTEMVRRLEELKAARI